MATEKTDTKKFPPADSSAKRARQSESRAQSNRRALTAVKTHLKAARAALKGKDKAAAAAAVKAFVSIIDKAVKSGRVHKNSASRHKSAVSSALAKLA